MENYYLYAVTRYLLDWKTNILLSINMTNMLYKYHYLYRQQIIDVDYGMINKYDKLSVKLKVNADMCNDTEKIMDKNIVEMIFNYRDFMDNYIVKELKLPKTVKKLSLYRCMVEEPVVLPPRIRELYIDNSHVKKLPDSLRKLIISNGYLNRIDNLPINLKSLTIYANVSYNINLPKNLKVLKFKNQENQDVNNLPENLRYLELGYGFNKEIHDLPKRLRVLKLPNTFDHSIYYLPDSIEYLMCYLFPVHKLPKNLKVLKVCKMIGITIGDLPDHIEYLYLCCAETKDVIKKVPKNLRKLVISEDYKYCVEGRNDIEIEYMESDECLYCKY